MRTVILVVVLIGIGVSLAALVYAVRRRVFAAWDRGFLMTLMLATVGVGLVTAAVLGLAGYKVARTILFDELMGELRNLGTVVEAEILNNIKVAHTNLKNLADRLAPRMGRLDLKEVGETFRDVQAFNPWWLQIRLYDRQGALLFASSTTGVTEAMQRVDVAYALEGKSYASDAYLSPVFKKYVLTLAVPIQAPPAAPVGVVTSRYAVQEDLAGHLGSARFRQSGYSVLTDNNGRILAHPDPARIGDDISMYPAVQRGRQGQTGWVVANNKAGQERLFAFRPVKSVASINPKPWVLLTEIDEDEVMAPIHTLRHQFVLAIAGVVVLGALVAREVSLSLKRPVQDLLHLVRRVQGGDLTGQAATAGRDEIGQLGDALNKMVRGLQERDRVKEVFGRYVTTQVSEEILKGQIDLGGRIQRATILFSDIRNFTAMSETMTPQQVVEFLNDYFSEMVEAVFEHNGVLDKFIGDAIMAVFGSLDSAPDHPRRAVLAALRMKALLAKINGERAVTGKAPIGMGIGIHTDDVIVGNIGSRKRLEYTVIGDGVNTCSRLQALNKDFGTMILISETTHEAVRDEFVCRPMPEAQLRGKAKPLQFYEVVSGKAG